MEKDLPRSAKTEPNGTRIHVNGATAGRYVASASRFSAAGATVMATARSMPRNGSAAQAAGAQSGSRVRLFDDEHTTIVIERYLGQLARLDGSAPVESIIEELIDCAVSRLHLLCRTLLVRGYSRLARPPLNLQPEELLSAVVDRLLHALREVRPTNIRQFFALANRHMRWELNDLARRLDKSPVAVEFNEALVESPASDDSELSPNARRMLDAVEGLPDEEREAFDLIRIQNLTQPEAAEVLGVSQSTLWRRLQRGLLLLTKQLSDLDPSITAQKRLTA